MSFTQFDREKHLYSSQDFQEMVNDALRFFSGTPVQPLPPPQPFTGAGVYVIYYTGRLGVYAPLGQANRTSYSVPIYAGKAVPQGWRQGRGAAASVGTSTLFNRLREHGRSISTVSNLLIEDFACRFAIFEDTTVAMISIVESSLIQQHRPLWNVSLDGFGNHDPGSGRYGQAKSDWDVLHPGRVWAERCEGRSRTEEQIRANVAGHLASQLRSERHENS